MGGAGRLTVIVAALAAIALSMAAAAQESVRVTYTVDRSNPEQIQIAGIVFNDSPQDVFDVSVTAEALDGRGKVVARGIAYVGAHWPGRGSAPSSARSAGGAAAQYRAPLSAHSGPAWDHPGA
jgi:hypothetical protein